MNIITNDVFVNVFATYIVLEPYGTEEEFPFTDYNLEFMNKELKKYDKFREYGSNWSYDMQISLEYGINKYVIKNLKDKLTEELSNAYPQEMEGLRVAEAKFKISFEIE